MILLSLALAADIDVPSTEALDLEAAIGLAGTLPGIDRILLAPGVHVLSSEVEDVELRGLGGTDVTMVAIQGSQVKTRGTTRFVDLTVDATGAGTRALDQDAGSNLDLVRVHILGPSGGSGGGGVRVRGQADLEAVVIDGSMVGGDGGGVLVEGSGSLVAAGLTVRASSANHGGALSVSGTADVRGVFFDGAVATNSGGALYVDNGGVLLLDGGIVRGGSAPTLGGGAEIRGEAQISGVWFDDDHAGGKGGAIAIRAGGDLTFSGRITQCSSPGYGGGIALSGTTPYIVLRDAWLEGNVSDSEWGGGLAFGGYYAGPHTISRTVFCGNQAPGDGGAVDMDGNWVTMDHVLVVENDTDHEGGGFWTSGGGDWSNMGF
ncbi:MAG: hypothetical protein KC656_34285, partial [Myxococcales bacterium]|nr:hypothetical protein [Myxococcales bacterium]